MSRKTTKTKTSLETVNNYLGLASDIAFPLCNATFEHSLMYDGFGSLTFGRSSIASYIDRLTKKLVFASVDQPRFEYEGILLESSTKNHIIRSNTFSHANWAKSSIVTTTSAVLDPTNISNSFATTLTSAGVSDSQTISYTRKFTEAGVNALTFSLFVKKGSTNPTDTFNLYIKNVTANITSRIQFTFDGTGKILSNPSLVYTLNITRFADYRIEELANGWNRLSFTIESINTIDTSHDYEFGLSIGTWGSNTNNKTINIYGSQVERKWYSTSYIATSGAEEIRSSDVLLIENDRNLPDLSFDHTLLLEVMLRGPYRIGTQSIFWTGSLYGSLPDNREKSRTIKWSQEANNNQGGFIINPSTQIEHILPTMTDFKVKHKIGYTRSSNIVHAFANGKIETTGIDEPYTAGVNTYLHFGEDPINNIYFDGHICNFRIYDRAFSKDEIIMV
jgi:hypothetical protein